MPKRAQTDQRPSVDDVVTAGNMVATAGNIVVAAGNIMSTLGNIIATAGNPVATGGNHLYPLRYPGALQLARTHPRHRFPCVNYSLDRRFILQAGKGSREKMMFSSRFDILNKDRAVRLPALAGKGLSPHTSLPSGDGPFRGIRKVFTRG